MKLGKDIFNEMYSRRAHISYIGPFESRILSTIAQNIEESLSENPLVSKKMFKIFLELGQNICLYSAEQVGPERSSPSGFGTVTIQEFENHYTFSTGNMTTLKDAIHIKEKINAINSMNRDELRDFKRQMRSLPPSSKGGGNIGLIQTALTADNPLQYKLIPADNNLIFIIISFKLNK